MIMVADSMPGLKRWLAPVGLSDEARLLVIRVVVAFVLHSGRMSCLRAAGAVRCESRHRAQISRFLARPRWRGLEINAILQRALLEREALDGLFIFVIDATLTSQAGKKTENTYSTGNRKRRPCKGRRFGKNKHAVKYCHSFTMGLLITPSGVRIPFSKPYHTREYCRKHGLTHRTTAEAAADLIRELPLPEARVIVLGDTAYDAEVVQEACRDRGCSWIVPCNSERVLAGPKGRRPKVRSLLEDWSTWSRQTLRLAPGQGPYAVYRRLSPGRIGPKAKPRTYNVHQERRSVHSVGDVQLVFSTMKTNLKTATADDVKILMTNDQRLSTRQVVELYSLRRWQIELFFKELKSTLGFHQYQFQKFQAVEGWMELALTTFMYLESCRARQLSRRDLSDEEKRWWRHQRTYGLCQAVRSAAEQNELKYIADRLKTPGGTQKLKRLVRNSFPKEYRATA